MNCHAHHRQRYVFWVLVVMLLCGLPACEQAAGETPPKTPANRIEPSPEEPGESVTIYFVTYDSAIYTFKTLAEEFHTLNPDIRVEVFAMPENNGEVSYEERLYRTVSTADTGLWWIDHIATRDGLVHDLSSFIEADSGFAPDDFYPGTLDNYRWDGGVWALPYAATVGLVYYDEQAFDDAGISHPKAGWTLEDFLRTAQQLTLREGQTTLRYGFVDALNAGRQSFILSQVGTLHDPATGLSALDSKAVAEAVRWYTDLTLVHGVMPDPSMDAVVSGYELIQTGRAAMWSAALGTTYGPEMPVRNIGAVPFPEANYPSNFASTNGYFMSQGTSHPQESWRWLSFLTRRQVALWSYLLPARRSVAEQTQYWAQFEPQEATAAQYAAEHLSLLMWDTANLNLVKALPRVFKGESVESVLDDAQQAALAEHEQWAQATPRAVVVTPPEAVSPDETPTASFAPPFYLEDPSAWAAAAEAFNREHPEMRVKIVRSDAGTVDCMADVVPIFQNIGTPTTLLNLQPLIERETAISLASIPDHFQNAISYQGSFWGLPFQAQTYVIYYNRELFDDAGLPYPEPGWTLDEFLTTAQHLTRGSGNARQWGYMPLNAPTEDLRVFLAVQGAQLWDDHGQPRFDAPDVVNAIAWYADLALKQQVMPTLPEDFPDYQSSTAQSQRTWISQGQVAMWSSYTDQDPGIASSHIGMVSLPTNAQGQGTAVFQYTGLFIASQTAHPEICWEWLQFLTTKAELAQGIPAHTTLLDTPLLQSQIAAETMATYKTALSYTPLPALTLSESAQIYQIYEAMGEILTGTSPETALSNAQQGTQP